MKELHRNQNKYSYTILIMILFTLLSIVFMGLMIHNVSAIQGTARVVNYAGIVRGATQQLIKNELRGNAQDAEIDKLDQIINGLQTGDRSLNLIKLQDEVYQDALNKLELEWITLKSSIYAARSNPATTDRLYQLSEAYFVTADHTVSAAEQYSDGVAERLNLIELMIVGCTSTNLIILVFQMISRFRLKQIAYVDPNTGLPNKRYCEEQLHHEGLCMRHHTVCCFMFDLNNLKEVNDSLGHTAGDLLITKFADLLRHSAPVDTFIGRLGGDEFIAIMPNATTERISVFTEKLQAANHTECGDSSNQRLQVSFAFGHACSDAYPDCSIHALLDIADRRMYQDKESMKDSECAS